MTNWRYVRASWLGGQKTEVDIRGVHYLISDEMHQFGGEDMGPMPTELLLSSLATCMTLAVVHAAKKKEINITDLSVVVTAEKEMQAFRFDVINVVVEADLPQPQLDSLVQRAKGYCFVTNTLVRGVMVNTTGQSIGGNGS